MPNSAEALKIQITYDAMQVSGGKLNRTWRELNYKWAICNVMERAHIKELEDELPPGTFHIAPSIKPGIQLF